MLDLGAGGGWDVVHFLKLGFSPEGIVALDILPDRVRESRRDHPSIPCLVADAAHLPFRDASFDLVYQSTMLSSVLEQSHRRAILGECGRVLRRGGVFLSYDTRYPNPWNPQTRPLSLRELRSAFAGWHLSVASLTGLPQLLRLVAPVSLKACRLIEIVPFLRSHALALVRKP